MLCKMLKGINYTHILLFEELILHYADCITHKINLEQSQYHSLHGPENKGAQNPT